MFILWYKCIDLLKRFLLFVIIKKKKWSFSHILPLLKIGVNLFCSLKFSSNMFFVSPHLSKLFARSNPSMLPFSLQRWNCVSHIFAL